MTGKLEESLISLGLTPEEVRIYFDLLESGATTAGELAKRIGMVRPTVYNCLQKMTEKGVITRTLRHGVRTFAAQPPRHVGSLFQRRIRDMEKQQSVFQSHLEELERKMATHFLSPRFQLYEGKDGLKHVIQEILLYRNIETLSFWPIKSMIDVLGPEFFEYHNRERIRNNTWIRAIWPHSQAVQMKQFPFMGMGEEFKRTIRVAPPEVDCTMGYWTYQNKVAFLSSKAESFGFIIESQEMVDMLTVNFEVVWNISTPLNYDPKDTESFLRTV